LAHVANAGGADKPTYSGAESEVGSAVSRFGTAVEASVQFRSVANNIIETGEKEHHHLKMRDFLVEFM
jgi:hypothetical protein